MGVDDDPLAAALSKHSVSRTTGTAPEPMMSASTCPGPDGWQLVDVSDDQQGRVVRDRFHERLHKQDVDHRGLVDDEQIASRGIVGVAFETAAPGIDLQEAVDRFGLDARRFGHALRRAACGRAKHNRTPLAARILEDRVDDRRLADAWAPGDHECLRRQRQADCRLLAVGKLQTAALFDPRHSLLLVYPCPGHPGAYDADQPRGDRLLRL